MTKILKVEKLNTEFRDSEKKYHKILHSIDFSLEKGKTLGVVGESGSGKTVTSLCIMGLLPQKLARISAGKILFSIQDEKTIDLLALSPAKHRTLLGKKLAMIFQEPMSSLNPVQRCGKQVVEILQFHKNFNKKQAKQRTLELFAEMELSNPEKIFRAYPHEISGGQKQRVMIAMALSCEPSILIADEPTTALDVTIQQSVLNLLKKLQNRYKMSIIFITHDLSVIANIADYCLVMYQGKQVEQGSINQIITNPKHPYTKALISCHPPMNNRLYKLPTVDDFINEKKDKSVFGEQNIISVDERNKRLEKLYAKESILKIKNLTKEYKIKNGVFTKSTILKAVDNVSFDLYPGETLGLVGESGCGKTTLSRSLLRLIEPSSGNIIFDNKDITQVSYKNLRKYRKRIQIIFQDPYSSLNERIKIGEAIFEPLNVHKIGKNDKERSNIVHETLEKVGLDINYYNRYPHELSGGQRQRVCIARALVLKPEILICDESVSALDVSVQAQILNLLNDLKKLYNLSYLFISHDLSVVKFMSDRLLVMYNGKIVEEGEPDKIYKSPQQTYTKKLIAAIPSFTTTLP